MLLYCIVLYCIVLYCIVLYCIVLYCIVLYCIVLCVVVVQAGEPAEAMCYCTVEGELCGSDGVDYENLCQLRAAAVVKMQKITVANKGPCKSGKYHYLGRGLCFTSGIGHCFSSGDRSLFHIWGYIIVSLL